MNKKAPVKLHRNGEEFHRSFQDEANGGYSPGNWPLISDAAGVHPSQVKEARRLSEKSGVPTLQPSVAFMSSTLLVI